MTTKFITLNTWDTEPVIVKVNQGEVNSRFLKVQFIDKNQAFNLEEKTVFFYAKKPDNNLIFNECEIIDAKDGTVNLSVTSQMSIVAGTMKDCEFRILDEELSKLKIKGLIIEIEPCTDFDSAIESTSEFTALDQSLKEVQDIINEFSDENIIKKITSIDGAGSGIDADLLDGKHGNEYATLEQFGNTVPQTRTINSKPLSSDIYLNCDDIGAAATIHEHSTNDMTSGILPIERGGTGATTVTLALENLGAVPQERKINSKALSSDIKLNCADVGAAEESHVHEFSELINTPTTLESYGITDAVPQTRTINSKALSSNIELTCADVGAAEESHVHEFGELINTPTTLEDYGIVDAVPQTRTINSKALSSNIELNCADVGAAAYETKSSTDFNEMTTPGLYTMCSSTINAPTSGSYHSLIVNKSDTGNYVQQIAIKESSYDIYVRYLNGSSWSDWCKLYTEKNTVSIAHGGTGAKSAADARSNLGVKGDVLYNNISGTSGTASLSASTANYNYLVIYFRNYNDSFSSIKIHSPNGKTTALELNDHNSSQGWFSRGCIATISGSSIILSNQNQAYISNVATWTPLDGAIKITRVEGWLI